jgi:hypothetical protein
MADFIQRRDQAIMFSDFRKQNLRAAGWNRLFMIPVPEGDIAPAHHPRLAGANVPTFSVCRSACQRNAL